MEQVSRKELKKAVAEIASLLGETLSAPKEQIRKIINVYGVEYARKLCEETLAIEEQGGLMVPDNSRRRTPGGVYFYLVRSRLSPEEQEAVFPSPQWKKKLSIPKPVSVPLVSWTERLEIIEKLRANQGEITSMKILLSGRPGTVEKRPEVVVTTMSHVATMPVVPYGMPLPPETPTLYTIYMTPKQWGLVEKSIEDPADQLHIEGICAPDPESKGMAVFVNNIRSELMSSKLQEAQKAALPPKQPKPAKPEKPEKAEKPAAQAQEPAANSTPQSTAKPIKKSRFEDIVSEPAAPKLPSSPAVNTDVPPEFATKLNDLYASASLFKQKVETILAKPKGQQFGLEMTQKLLKNVEDEIAAIERKFKK